MKLLAPFSVAAVLPKEIASLFVKSGQLPPIGFVAEVPSDAPVVSVEP